MKLKTPLSEPFVNPELLSASVLGWMRKRNMDERGQIHIEPRLLYFLAGHFEGEGCLTFKNSPTAEVSHTYLPVLKLYAFYFGGSIRVRKSPDESHKKAWRWRIHGENTRYFIDTIINYLMEKQPQARVLRELDQEGRESPRRDLLLEELKLLKRSEVEE